MSGGSLLLQLTNDTITYQDTSGYDFFAGFSTSVSTAAPPGDAVTFGIEGAESGMFVASDFHAYDVRMSGTYGTLYLNSQTGGTYFSPSVVMIESLKAAASETFTITATDQLGQSDTKTLTINLQGVNDNPTFVVGFHDLLKVPGSHDAGVSDSVAAIQPFDADAGDAVTYDVAALVAGGWSSSDGGLTYVKAGTYGTASLDIAANLVSYHLDYTNPQVGALTYGQSASDSFSIPVTDGAASGASTVLFGIMGDDGGPFVSATTPSQLVEGGDLLTPVLEAQATLTLGTIGTSSGVTQYDTFTMGFYGWVTDDDGATWNHNSILGSSITLDTSTNVITYALKPSMINMLPNFATAEAVGVFVTDGNGHSAYTTVTFNILGNDSAPVVSTTAQSNAIVEAGLTGVGNGSASIGLSLFDPDGMDFDTLNTAQLLANGWQAILGGYTHTATYGTVTLDGSGLLATYTLDQSLADALGDGESAIDSVTIPFTDLYGATTSKAVNFTITGANDGPLLTPATADIYDTPEANDHVGFLGTLAGVDIDANDVLTYSVVGGSLSADSSFDVFLKGKYGTLNLNSNSGAYLYIPTKGRLDSLKSDITDTFKVSVSDGHGATSQSTLTIAVHGTNDAPSPLADRSKGGETDAQILNVLANDKDHDTGDTLTFGGIVSASVQSPVTAINALKIGKYLSATSGGEIHFNPGTAFEALDAGQAATVTVVYQVSDGVLPSQATATFTVNGSKEIVVGTIDDDTLVGGKYAEVIDGLTGNDIIKGAGGNDLLQGNYGDDTISGGEGNDTLDGGIGIDTATYASAAAGVTVSLASSSTQSTIGAGNDKLSGFENLTGSRYGDVLTGDGGENTLAGGAGDDVLKGGKGDDALRGGDGDDVLRGGDGDDVISAGEGNDTIDGANGSDTATYAAASGPVIVSLAISSEQSTGSAGEDTLKGIENLTGSRHGDVLTGNSGANALAGGSGDDSLLGGNGDDILDGGSGDDFLAAGSGNDIISGGSGNDTLSYADAKDRVSVDLGVATTQGTGLSGLDTITSVENVIGSKFADQLTGSKGNNVITGGLGADELTGGGGHDTFVYRSVAESTGSRFDTITDMSFARDQFIVPGAITGIDARITSGNLSSGSFDVDLAAIVDGGKLGAHHAVIFRPSDGSYDGLQFLIVDANGMAGYQAGQDIVIGLQPGVDVGHLSTANFMLLT